MIGSRQPRSLTRLRIWQQNLRKSHPAQLDMLATAKPEDWDVLAIKEPYLDHLGNSRASQFWKIIYPANHRTSDLSNLKKKLKATSNLSYKYRDAPTHPAHATRRELSKEQLQFRPMEHCTQITSAISPCMQDVQTESKVYLPEMDRCQG